LKDARMTIQRAIISTGARTRFAFMKLLPDSPTAG